MAPIISGFTIICWRSTPCRYFRIGLEFVFSLDFLNASFVFCEFINHPCGLFVILDVSQSIAFSVDDRVRLARCPEIEIVVSEKRKSKEKDWKKKAFHNPPPPAILYSQMQKRKARERPRAE
ncbi:hypothetical protein SDC9_163437 [bioreactor metagenome]|uniref:Uncharacterized protein n=1 Tax=bioreactor metagenome TaxID=1076179 RepID=A0A645FRQ5_9ZZZZ